MNDTSILYETFDANTYCNFVGKGTNTGENSKYVYFKIFEIENPENIVGVVGTEYRAFEIVEKLNNYGYSKCIDAKKYTYEMIPLDVCNKIMKDEKLHKIIKYRYTDLFEIIKMRDNKGDFINSNFPFFVSKEKIAYERMISFLEQGSRYFSLRTCMITVIDVNTYDKHKCNGCKHIKFISDAYYTCINPDRKIRDNPIKPVICLYYK